MDKAISAQQQSSHLVRSKIGKARERKTSPSNQDQIETLNRNRLALEHWFPK